MTEHLNIAFWQLLAGASIAGARCLTRRRSRMLPGRGGRSPSGVAWPPVRLGQPGADAGRGVLGLDRVASILSRWAPDSRERPDG
jgi:hypothetical protein